MDAMTEQPQLPPITGTGSFRIQVRLHPVPHVPSHLHMPEAFDAVELVGADFKGEHESGTSMSPTGSTASRAAHMGRYD